MKDDIEKRCYTCKWYAEFEGVCTNYKSENCADFIDPDSYCEGWEQK